jgi:hypothetical protein
MRIGLQGPISHASNALCIQYKYFYLSSKPAFRARSTRVLVVRGKLSELHAETRVFGHLPACNWLAQHAGGGAWEAAGHLPRAAGGQGKANPSTALSDFAFRGQGAMRDKMYGLVCGGMSPTRVVLNHCKGLRQEALLPTPCDLSGRASISWQSGPLLQWLLSQPPSPKTTTWSSATQQFFWISSILCPRGASLGSNGLWNFEQAKVKQSGAKKQRIADTNSR